MEGEQTSALPSPPGQESSVPLLLAKPGAAIPYLLLMLAAVVAGVTGNLLILAAFWVSERVRVVGNEFVFNLALVDLVISLVATPMLLVGEASL